MRRHQKGTSLDKDRKRKHSSKNSDETGNSEEQQTAIFRLSMTSRSTNHSFTGMICWVSENLRRNIFRAIETKNAAPFIGRFLSFSHFHTFQSHVGHSISLVYSKLLTLSVTNSKLLMKVQLSERQFLDRNHAEKVLTVTCLITFCI